MSLDGNDLKVTLEEAETFVEKLRQQSISNTDFAAALAHLLIGIGRALSKDNRSEDSIAVLKDALEFSKQR